MKGDAAGEIDVGDGTWTEELRERYADRIQARLARHIPNLESSILDARRPLARRPRRRRTSNLVARRPLRRRARARPELPLAAVPAPARARDAGRGALAHRRSTHPGPGLGGGSGALVAEQLLEPPAAKRLLGRARKIARLS